jgi:hypothetical protein
MIVERCILKEKNVKKREDETIMEIILAARTLQEFLWGDMNNEAGLEEFKRMFRKRLAKIDEITFSNPHWKIELKKRLLQTTAIAVNLMTKIDNDELTHEGIHPKLPSNLPDYAIGNTFRLFDPEEE